MELRVLRYFLAVAREQNITRAAQILNITQPTLSRQLMQLEDELSAQLFYREKNRIVLTEEGMLLKKRAEDLVELADRTEREFQQHDELMTGDIYLGAGEVHSMHILAKEMKKFKELYPLVQFHMFSGNADDIKEKMDHGLIDIALLLEPVDVNRCEFIRLKEKDTWGVLVRNDSPLAQKEYVKVDDIKDEPLIMSKRVMVQNEISHWFGENFDNLNIVSTFNLVHNASIMAEEGLGIVLTIDKLVYTSHDLPLRFIPLYPHLETGSLIVWKNYQVFSPAKRKFIEQLKSHLKESS